MMVYTAGQDEIEYGQNYLTEVVARIDFVSPLANIKDQLPQSISKAALSNFPINEVEKGVAQQFELTPGSMSTRAEEVTFWNFYSRGRGKWLQIQPKAMFVSYKRYTTYQELRSDFIGICNALFEAFHEAQPSRLGLRYINQINAGSGNPLNWSTFINGELLGLFSFKSEDAEFNRIFHTLEYVIKEEFNLRFQFGLHNPDYPATIRRRLFTLDYDAYYKGLLEPGDVETSLDSFHQVIQAMFEGSITENLREKMNEQ